MKSRMILKRPNNLPSIQSGMTLIELMVSSALGLIILLGVLAVYENGKKTYNATDALSRQQEYARYTFNRFTQELRMVGYAGCVGSLDSLSFSLNSSTDFAYRFNSPLEGFEATTTSWSPSLDAAIATPKTGTDVITFRATYGDAPVIANHQGATQGNGDITIRKDHQINTDDIVMISNCEKATVFQVTDIDESNANNSKLKHVTGGSSSPGNSTAQLGGRYRGGEIMKLSTTTYLVREITGEIPSLWRQDGENTPVKLVDGVEDMQILYGEDTDTADNIVAASEYRKASDVTDWNQVISIRVSLLLVSEDSNLATSSQTYNFNGTTRTATDKRVRHVFNTTVTLRNKSG